MLKCTYSIFPLGSVYYYGYFLFRDEHDEQITAMVKLYSCGQKKDIEEE